MRGLFGTIAAGLEQKVADASDLTWERLLGEDLRVKSGVSVNIDSALRNTTVLGCGRVLGEGIAQLPLKVYRLGANGSKTPATDHPAYKLLYRRPNDWMTSFEFRETAMLHAVLGKGAYAYINRVRKKPVELLPIMPHRVTVEQSDSYEVTYTIRDAKGVVLRDVPRGNMLHLRGPSWDGICGLDVVQTAREAIGLAIATEETHARLHENGAQPGGILSIEGGLSDPARKRLKEDWLQLQGGLRNKFKTAVLDQKAKWEPMGMKGVDAQHLETRRHQVEEICRAFRVFPQMIGFSDKTATFASAESFFIAHVIHSLGPWIERWEEVLWRDLLDDDLSLEAKFSVQGLLRGDSKSRAEYYTSGIVNGYFTRNEVRLWEELNPLPGLDEPLVPLNMGTQADRDAIAAELVETAKAALIGHNGGPPLDDAALERMIEGKLEKLLCDAAANRFAAAGGTLTSLLTH